MTVSSAPPTLAERVDTFVQWLFEDFKPVLPTGPKVFNDALLGHLLFAKHEVAVIDCPVLQRLRRIKQTGLVYHVFPSATHSRFEHSLGAAALSKRCFDAIRERAKVEGTTFPADDDDLAHLRMAALLHDVGHGLCSHASEQIYEQLSDLREFKDDKRYTANQPGEILSYLIVGSPTFRRWFEEFVVRGCQVKLDLRIISDLILGRHDDRDKYFLAQIVSGAYDCDKLDYIARDSYYCGLALTVDLPRFYSMISTGSLKNSRMLALRSYVPLEQILFSKMTLFGSVYHHQKVKCLDSMLRSMIGHIVQNPEQAKFPIRGGFVSFADPVEYLYATDDEFFSQAGGFGDEYIKGMLARFRNRDLFVRCLEISRRTVNNWAHYGRQLLIDLTEKPQELVALENKIHVALPAAIRSKCNRDDIRLSVPGIPPVSGEGLIQTYRGAEPVKIKKYFPVTEWTQSYAHNKWRSYVYAPREIASEVRDAAISVLHDYSKLEVDAGKSNLSCHL